MESAKIVRQNLLVLKSLVLIGALFFLVTCDGTTSGTGTGNKISLEGRVLYGDSVPAVGIVARLAKTGLSDTTDSQGRYYIFQDNVPVGQPLDTLDFFKDGQKVFVLEITQWVDSLPDVKFTRVVTQPASQTVVEGTSVTFTVAAEGAAPLVYQWQRQGSNNLTDIIGANAASYSFIPALSDNGAMFRCVVSSNSIGTDTSQAAFLTVTKASGAAAITSQPSDRTLMEGFTATFVVLASGNPAPSYQWQRSQGSVWTNITGATTRVYSLISSAADSGALFRCVVSNSMGSDTSATVTLTVNQNTGRPIIVSYPQSQTLVEGGTAVFTVSAVGAMPMTYQWRRNGADIIGIDSNSYSLTSTLSDNGAIFYCLVSNAYGTDTSRSATLTVTTASGLPAITLQPIDRTVTEGFSVAFTVQASGNPAPSYQWQRLAGSWANITTATSASFILAHAMLSDSGAQFRAIACNSNGCDTSAAAALTVNPNMGAPLITSYPQNQTVLAGDTVTFTVSAVGAPVLNYQWQRNETNIAGANTASFVLTAMLFDNGVRFSCLVSNSFGADTSMGAVLNVTP